MLAEAAEARLVAICQDAADGDAVQFDGDLHWPVRCQHVHRPAADQLRRGQFQPATKALLRAVDIRRRQHPDDLASAPQTKVQRAQADPQPVNGAIEQRARHRQPEAGAASSIGLRVRGKRFRHQPVGVVQHHPHRRAGVALVLRPALQNAAAEHFQPAAQIGLMGQRWPAGSGIQQPVAAGVTQHQRMRRAVVQGGRQRDAEAARWVGLAMQNGYRHGEMRLAIDQHLQPNQATVAIVDAAFQHAAPQPHRTGAGAQRDRQRRAGQRFAG